jgi:hypothetical protein
LEPTPSKLLIVIITTIHQRKSAVRLGLSRPAPVLLRRSPELPGLPSRGPAGAAASFDDPTRPPSPPLTSSSQLLDNFVPPQPAVPRTAALPTPTTTARLNRSQAPSLHQPIFSSTARSTPPPNPIPLAAPASAGEHLPLPGIQARTPSHYSIECANKAAQPHAPQILDWCHTALQGTRHHLPLSPLPLQ